MKRILFAIFKIAIAIYVVICGLLYFFQEKLIFHPEKLNAKYKFTFDQKFEEINIKTFDKSQLNGILFKADSSKGLIFYLHGNGGSLRNWGAIAGFYTNLNYDVFMLDYRGYGKSEGKISSQDQIFQDIQDAYNEMKKKYQENKIVILGYSIGTGLAAKAASENNPKLLILQAPYYSLTDMMTHKFPIIPTFILKYTFETYKYVARCKAPIVIFHGDQDEVIYYNSSIKLKKNLKITDTLITLDGQGHNGMTENNDYRGQMKKLLGR
jgi:uncharacterized protein